MAMCTINDPYSFFNNTFTFTGKLNLMTREAAFRYVERCGGRISPRVSRTTDILVVGDYHDKKCIRNKYRQAEKLISKGQDIAIVDEQMFYLYLLRYMDNAKSNYV